MSLDDQAATVLILTLVLYGLAMIGLLLRGWLFRAGLVTFLISCLPGFWQILLTDSDAPGFGILFLLMFPVPLLLMALGIVRAVFRGLRRYLRRAA